MMLGQKTFLPCTPFSIMMTLRSKQIAIVGRHVVIIGRIHIVDKPIGQLLLNEHATVTYCHFQTKNLKIITKQADILIVAVGKPNMIAADDVKDGVIIINVGINRLDDGTLTGDVDFQSVREKVSYITLLRKVPAR